MRHIEDDINLEPGNPLSIEICPRALFSSYIYQIQTEAEGGSEAEDFIIADGDRRIKLKGCPVISSPFSLDFQSKAILQALYKRIQNEMQYSGEHEEKINKAFKIFLDEIKGLLLEINLDTSIEDDFDVQKALKLFGVSVDYEIDETPKENIGSFIEVMSQLLIGTPIFFVNQKLYMTDDELSELFEEIEGYNALVIFLESYSHDAPVYGVRAKIDSEFDFFLSK